MLAILPDRGIVFYTKMDHLLIRFTDLKVHALSDIACMVF